MEGAPNKKPALPTPKLQNFPMARKHCSKCERTNHDTTECRMRTNQCFWYGDSNHLIANCPAPLASQQKAPSSIPKGAKAATLMTNRLVGRAYIIKAGYEAATVVTSTLTFNLIPLIVLFDSGASHSCLLYTSDAADE